MSLMRRRRLPFTPRWTETALLIIATLLALVGFFLSETAYQLRNHQAPTAAWPLILKLLVSYALPVWSIHFTLCWRKLEGSQLLLPTLGVILAIGLVMVNRTGGTDLAFDQIYRGYWPGCAIIVALLFFPGLVETLMRRRWSVLLLAIGSLLLLAVTASAGASGATSTATPITVQVTELVKVAAIFFIAWYIDWVGEDAGQPEYAWGVFAYPRLTYLAPGGVFFGLAAILLFRLADLGAILILGPLFIALLYAGLHPRAFASIVGVGLVIVFVLGAISLQFLDVPIRVQDRWEAFRDPWSHEMSLEYTEPIYLSSGVQLQQAIYGTIAGGLVGQGIGFGHPEFIPLSLSDFILAAIAEELGLVVVLPLLALFLILFWQILRTAMALPERQLFERIVLIGISAHLCLQLIFMAAGVWRLFVMTGITTPFLSKGGAALVINLAEMGVVFALTLRLEGRHA